jgi:ABC-type molybdate transport system permease subunit
MSFSPMSRQDKAIQAIVLWLFAVLVFLALWDLALVSSYCFWPLSQLLELPLCLPAVPGMAIMLFLLRREDGIEANVLHYLPAVMIASAFTAWVLSRWWRRG